MCLKENTMGTFAEAKEKFYKNLNKVDCTFEEWLKANTNVMHHRMDLQLFVKYSESEGYYAVNDRESIGALALSFFKEYANLKVKHVFIVTTDRIAGFKSIHMYLDTFGTVRT